MANQKVSNKRGMGGSKCGRGRTMGTADYKLYGKSQRRQESKQEERVEFDAEMAEWENAATYDIEQFEREP